MNVLKKEKRQLNPIRKIMNHVVVPIYGILAAADILAAICLMTADEKRYIPVFIALMCFFVLITAALLISVPFVRKKEAVIEAAKFDLDFESVEKRKDYAFEQRYLIGYARTANAPFEELTAKTITVKGFIELGKALYPLCDDDVTPAALPDDMDFFIADLTSDNSFTQFEIEKTDDGKVNIYEKSSLVFTEGGACINGENFLYSDVTAIVDSVRVLNQVQLSVNFRFGENLCASLKLDKNIIAIIKQFDINVTNEGALNALLTDKINTFEQVLKYSKIKKY